MVGLPGQGGHELEVCVVVQHGELTCFGHRGDETVDEGQRAVLTPFDQEALYFQSSTMVTVGDGHECKRIQPVHQRPEVSPVTSTEAEFEHDRRAQRNGALGDQRGDGSENWRLREPGSEWKHRWGKRAQRQPCVA